MYLAGVRLRRASWSNSIWGFRLCPTLLVLIAESTCPESFRGEKRVARKSAENIPHNRYFLPPFRGIEYTIQLVRLHGSGL